MSKIFITGSTGFIGSNLVTRFKDYGYEVIGFTRDQSINSCLNYHKPDIIINSAADIYDSSSMFLVNVQLVQQIVEYVRQNPTTRLIQLGSSSEYGPCSIPTNECMPVNAWDCYGASKSAATLLCVSQAQKYELDIKVVRPYSPYGPGERPHRLFPRLWRAFKNNEPMKLVDGVHDFCYIDDFVNAIELIIAANNNIPGEIINVSSGVQTSNLEVLQAFQKVTGQAGLVDFDSTVFSTPAVWQCDNNYIKTKYGWQIKYTLEQGIEAFLNRATYE